MVVAAKGSPNLWGFPIFELLGVYQIFPVVTDRERAVEYLTKSARAENLQGEL